MAQLVPAWAMPWKTIAFLLHSACMALESLSPPSHLKTARFPASGEEIMSSSERRIDPRVNVRVPLRFRILNNPESSEQIAESENISQRGIYFTTAVPLKVGMPLEVSLRMPQGTGREAIERCEVRGARGPRPANSAFGRQGGSRVAHRTIRSKRLGKGTLDELNAIPSSTGFTLCGLRFSMSLSRAHRLKPMLLRQFSFRWRERERSPWRWRHFQTGRTREP